MGLQDFLTVDRVQFNLHASCKREAIALIAERAGAVTGLPAARIKEALLEREQLGSTGVGRGVAIPHGKIDGLSDMVGLFAKLDRPIDFESVDDEPVDLVFVLLAPANASAAHLKALAKISRLLRDDKTREALRGAKNAEAFYAIASDTERSHAA